jgi:hypothetical protein
MLNRIKFLLILCILFPTTFINAQFSVGIFGGVNNSGLIGDAPQGSTYRDRTGFETGILAEYKITSDVGISLQPMFIEKGVKIAYSVFSEREPIDSLEIAINYFSVPILMKVYAGNEIMYVSGGFDIGYKLDATFKGVESGLEKDVTDAFKDFNIAAIVGVGAQFRLSQFYIFLEGRYSQGLGNNSSPDPDDPKEINPSFRTSGLQLFAGLIYSFGGINTED